MTIKLANIMNTRFGKAYMKTIYACSCSNKQDGVCDNCSSKIKCLVQNGSSGFVSCDYKVYDFDKISIKINNNTTQQSVDSFIINNDTKASFIEFTDGNPRNKKTYKKCVDSITTLEKLNTEISVKDFDYYYVYNTKKLNKLNFKNYTKSIYDNIDDDLFLGLMDLNANDDILIRYFTLVKTCDLFANVYPCNQNKFLSYIKTNEKDWKVYNE